ncbi:uncharacterized protein LOC114378944 [Glycine soja]|uniref:uncharacterized protein LOC114378944 n=1 Tax=Glycine soja TaxID=3848 RepID=UPI0003DEAAC9|nr:uncharacterized protein LOC114378944 [Glycine soja]|eukprot:XP_006593228.1 uncharacterized protein LOC102662762 [Glycine max]
MSFLWHVISRGEIAVDHSKVEAVMSWESPKSVFEIRSFLDLAGYYRRFIEGFSKLALPLTKLTRKGQAFVWDAQCESSFRTLKERLTTTLVLALPNSSKPFVVYCDASKMGLGGVLMQRVQVSALMVRELDLLEQFRDMSLACEITFGNIKLGMLIVTGELLSKNREGQKFEPLLSA